MDLLMFHFVDMILILLYWKHLLTSVILLEWYLFKLSGQFMFCPVQSLF